MSLLSLANELLLSIAEGLDDARDTAVFLRVNCRLAILLTPLLRKFMVQKEHAKGVLFWAAANRDEPIIRFILEKGEGIEVDMPNINPPLPSRGTEDERLVRFVLNMSVLLTLRDEETDLQITGLIWAVQNHHYPLMKILLNSDPSLVNPAPWGCGSSPTVVYSCWRNDALLEAAGLGAEEAVRILLDNGADIETETRNFLRPLHKAVGGDHLPVIQLLLEEGADPAPHNSLQQPEGPIGKAIRERRTAAVALMMQYVNVDFEDVNRRPALVVAAELGDFDLVKLLLDKGANPAQPDVNGRTTLHVAAKWGLVEIVRLLVERGADTEAMDHGQRTALHNAAQYGPEAIEVLLELGADVNAVDIHLMTALHLAGKNQHALKSDLEALIAKGARTDAEDNRRRTPQKIMDAFCTQRFRKVRNR